MLRAGLALRGLGDDLGRRWSEKPLTAADADDPDAAAKSVGAAAENEFRVAAGAYRPHVPPGARAAYDRSTDEVAEAVNKQTSDAFRARARAAHEDNARATFDATREHLVAAHDQAVRDGDDPRAETLAGQIADLDHFRRAYLRAAPADTAVKTAPTEEPKAQPATTEPAPGHDPASVMPGSADADTAKALSPDAPKGLTPRDRVKPTESRDPATTSTMDVMSHYDAPTDHARALRGLFLELPHLGRRDADGKLLAAPEEFDAHLEKARPHIRPEHFAEYEAIVRRLQAGEISALAAERELRELYEVIPEWEQTAELVLDLLPFIGGTKAAIEFFVTTRRLDEAIEIGDETEADRLSLEAAGMFIALGIGGAVRIPGLARLATKLPGAPELAAWLRQRQARRHRERVHDTNPDPRSSTYIPPASTVAKLDREVDDFARTAGTWNRTLEGREASVQYLERARLSGDIRPGDLGHYPYANGTKVIDVTTTKELTLIRVGRHPNDGAGRWLMRPEDFETYRNQLYAAERIRDRVAIPNEPIYFTVVNVPKGTNLRIGTANAHDTYGRGWGVQVEVMSNLSDLAFSKPRPIALRQHP